MYHQNKVYKSKDSLTNIFKSELTKRIFKYCVRNIQYFRYQDKLN